VSSTLEGTSQRTDPSEAIHGFRANHAGYARVALRIQTKAGELIPFEFNRAQQIVASKIGRQRSELGYVRALILKARQEGISTWVGSRIFRGCTLWFGRNALILADSDSRAEAIARIYERFRDNLPEELRPVERASRRGTELLFDRKAGGGLDAQIAITTAGGKDPGRGLTRQYVHGSEVAWWDHQLEVLTGALQAVPHGAGEVYLESTAHGVGDEFWNMWQAAEAGESEWLAIFLPWWIHEEYSLELLDSERAAVAATEDPWERAALDVGIPWEGEVWRLTPEQIAWRRWKIANDFAGDSRLYRQEFPAFAREAFLVSGNAFFDEEALVRYEEATRTTPPIYRANFVKAGGGFGLRPAVRGYVSVWEEPDPAGHYVVAADTAEGKASAKHDPSLTEASSERGGRDFSSADVLKVSELVELHGKPQRVPCLRQVAHIHERMAPEVFAEQIAGAALYWSCPTARKAVREWALTGVERNHSSGQTTLRILRENYGHPNLYSHRRMNERTQQITTKLGWITDGDTRMPMLDELGAVVRGDELGIRHALSVGELLTFVRDDAGRPAAQEGAHDDRVISLAIAVQLARHHHTDEAIGARPKATRQNTPTGV